MKVQAQYRRNGATIKTRFYGTPEEAQDALAKRIGAFHYLGRIAGDGFRTDTLRCEDAPRNGGLVSLEYK
jgi:hypothetical protein